MKNFAIIFLCFFLFACEKQNPTIEPEEIKIENISHKENPHQKCADNSPLKANDKPKIYWTFENENDKKCWYLGYIDQNFFLTNEDDFLVKYATGENFDGSYGNVMYSDFGSTIQKIQKEFYELSFHELPSFHIYFPNVDEKFLQKFAKNSIILPENPLKIIEWKTEKAFDESFSDDIANFLKQDFQKDIENILQNSTLQSVNNDEKLKAIWLTAKEITEISLKRFEKRKQQQEIIKNSILTNIKISDLYNFLREKQKSH